MLTRQTFYSAKYPPEQQSLRRSFSVKDSAGIRAELIKRKLLTRKDLMQVYKPPMKKSEFPANNPFLTKTIIRKEDLNAAMIKVASTGDEGKINRTSLMHLALMKRQKAS